MFTAQSYRLDRTQVKLDKTSKESERKDGTINALMDTVTVYKVRDTLNIASKAVLNLTIDEINKYRAEDLKLRPKDVESLAKVSTETKDTIPKHKWVPSEEVPGCLEYVDKWATITACFSDSMVMYTFRDSLAMIVHRVPKRRFLWWRWGTKGYKVEVVNFNPKSTIKFNEFVRVPK